MSLLSRNSCGGNAVAAWPLLRPPPRASGRLDAANVGLVLLVFALVEDLTA
jgi:hypothetical protein